MDCPFCESKLSSKQNLIKHLNKKYKCSNSVSSENYSIIIEKIKNSKYNREINLKDEEDSKKNNLECSICNKKFNSPSSIYYHRKNVCKTEIQEKNPCFDIKKELEELKLKLDNLVSKPTLNYINNGTINNTQTIQNFKFNDWGKEDLSFLKYEDIIENGPWQTVPNLFQKIHFNPNQLKNYNCRIPPGLLKSKLMEIKKNGKWIKCVRFDELSEKEQLLRNYIIDYAEENKNNIPEKKYERICKYRDVMEERDINSKEYKEIIGKLELIAMNDYISMEEGLLALVDNENINEIN